MYTKKKLLIYSITLTVAVLLVSLCVMILIKNKNFEKEYSMRLSFPPTNFYEDNYGCSLAEILSYRKFTTYSLTNTKSDENLFTTIQSATKSLIQKNDSKNGVHVKFNEKTKYGDVIKILDICSIEKAPVYIVKDYDVWIMTGTNEELEKNCILQFKNPDGTNISTER